MMIDRYKLNGLDRIQIDYVAAEPPSKTASHTPGLVTATGLVLKAHQAKAEVERRHGVEKEAAELAQQ